MGRKIQIRLSLLKKALVDAGPNYAAAAKLYRKRSKMPLTRAGVAYAVWRYEPLKKFRKAGTGGRAVRISRPELRELAEKYPWLRKDLALQETIFWLLKTRNLAEVAEHLGLNQANIRHRLAAIGGIETILRKEELIRVPKNTIKILDSGLRKIAEEHPTLRGHLAVLETINRHHKTRNAQETAHALGLKKITVYQRLRGADKATAALRVKLPKKHSKELNLI